MHGYQKFIFNKHKQRKKYDQHKGETKSSIHPLLTKHLLDRLSKANEMTGPTDAIKFACADMHGNLKFILHNLPNGRYVIPFKTNEHMR